MRLLPALVAALALLVAGAASARESPPFSTARDVATLVTDTDAVAAGQPFQAGLRLRLAPGWHTYWHNPGDAGLAPELSLALPAGAAAGPIAWPAPQRVAEGPITTFAYTGDVLLPVTVTPGAGPLRLQAHADWLVCSTLCVPEEADFSVDLVEGIPTPSAEAPLFAAAAARTPTASPYAATVTPDGTLSVRGAGLGAAVRQAVFYPDIAGVIDASASQPLALERDAMELALQPARGFHPGEPLTGLLALTDRQGVETLLTIVARPAPAAAKRLTVGRMLLLALAGGLILNVMPCVFPVLAMKAFGLARLARDGRAQIRAHATSYTAGAVLAFAALGGVLLAVRAAGQAAGWGFQFQSPVFVAAMACLLFGVGLNLSGVFAVGGMTGVGQSLAGRGGHWGSFFTGLLAVVVAAPCTAPFMGAAVAGALVAPPPVTVLVFAAMGLGLALPYAILALAPGIARLLPRPGAWMDVLKQALAFPMYGAAAWLVWVVAQEAGPDGVLRTLAGLLTLGFAAWAWGRSQASGSGGRRLGQAAALAGMIGVAALLPGISVIGGGPEAGTEPFSAGRLAELRQQGRPVFVNMTAAWCVSCLVNERVALAPKVVQDAFKQRHVAYLRGDWTRQDPAISSFLHDHGREGVPLYVFYPPGAPSSVLPQILTQQTVLDRIAGHGA